MANARPFPHPVDLSRTTPGPLTPIHRPFAGAFLRELLQRFREPLAARLGAGA